ncbi:MULTISPECIES: hypothetical protein [unclassified Mycobacterium]|uniref:hypothetical protein n=1 Tax=unclassified Mycobacterium TaxID=2642494 RepID=UPI0018D3925E|nr:MULTISPECIES: hypothetical protein [unclassified Mycobacterium]
MSTAVVVVIVAALMLVGIGMVVNQLLRLRRYLGESPPQRPPGPDEPPADGPP